jgi:hypothetical protein
MTLHQTVYSIFPSPAPGQAPEVAGLARAHSSCLEPVNDQIVICYVIPLCLKGRVVSHTFDPRGLAEKGAPTREIRA